MCLATTDAGAQSTAPKAVDPRPGYTGLFKFTGGARERKAHDAAIERATEDLFFVIRGVARSRLRERTAIAEWVHFEFPDTRIKATVPGHAAAVSPASGAPTRFKVDDEVVELRQYFADGHLVQRFTAEDGSRTNDYTLDAKGAITMRVTVKSPKLPKPLRYTLTYAR